MDSSDTDDADERRAEWFGPDDGVTISADLDQRKADQLYEWFGDLAAVSNEQGAWLTMWDDYRANREVSGMPPEIADDLQAMLQDGGGLLLSPGDDGFVLLKPSGSGLRFGTETTDGGHRIMDIDEMDADQIAAALANIDQERLVQIIVDIISSRPDLDGSSELASVWAALHSVEGLELADVFAAGLERGLVDADELQAAVDAATN